MTLTPRPPVRVAIYDSPSTGIRVLPLALLHVKPTERLAETKTPDGSRITLLRHDRDYYLKVDDTELMSTRRSHSEAELAEAGCANVVGKAGATALIGGLGFGFTLRATLALLGPDAKVTVAELLQPVIDWNMHPEWGAALAGDLLRDPRVTVRRADVRDVLRESPGAFDAILLDVDNGADAFTTSANAALYTDAGLQMTVAALREGGTIAYWSEKDDPRFMRRLRGRGLQVTSRRSRAHRTSGGFHTVIVGRRT